MALTTQQLLNIRRHALATSVMGRVRNQLLELSGNAPVPAPKRWHGEGNPNAKISDHQVAQIVALRGTTSLRTVASRFGISRMQVSRIWTGKTRAA